MFDTSISKAGKKASRSTRVRVLSGVLVGDFMHNLCDGIFMGTAFRFCNGPLAWSVTLATIFHEIAQELSDYLVLTDPAQGALQPPLALLLNGLSGLSVLLGLLVPLQRLLLASQKAQLTSFVGLAESP